MIADLSTINIHVLVTPMHHQKEGKVSRYATCQKEVEGFRMCNVLRGGRRFRNRLLARRLRDPFGWGLDIGERSGY
jgi:hypothetical protein